MTAEATARTLARVVTEGRKKKGIKVDVKNSRERGGEWE
jgi:hypothetical protein